MDLKNFYIRFSGNKAKSPSYASELQQYLAERSARAGIPLSMTVQNAGQDSPRLELSAGSRGQEVIDWVLDWLQAHSSVTAFAENMDGSSSAKLSPPERRDAERPRRLPDSDFKMEFKTFKF
jgi:hypothetical protein